MACPEWWRSILFGSGVIWASPERDLGTAIKGENDDMSLMRLIGGYSRKELNEELMIGVLGPQEVAAEL
jgi:hypothetical protein